MNFLITNGEGIVLPESEQFKLFPEEYLLAEELIKPGDKTDLRGFFNRKLQYLGADGSGEMVFFMGNSKGRNYYQVVCYITPKDMFIMYAPKSGRNYTFKKGAWTK